MTDLSITRSYPSIRLCVEALRAAGYEPSKSDSHRLIPRLWEAGSVTPANQPKRVRIIAGMHSYPHPVKVVPADGGPTGGMAA